MVFSLIYLSLLPCSNGFGNFPVLCHNTVWWFLNGQNIIHLFIVPPALTLGHWCPAWTMSGINVLFTMFRTPRRRWETFRKTKHWTYWLKLFQFTYQKSLRERHLFQAEILEKACWRLPGGNWLRRHRQIRENQCSMQPLECSGKGLVRSCGEWRCALCALGKK